VALLHIKLAIASLSCAANPAVTAVKARIPSGRVAKPRSFERANPAFGGPEGAVNHSLSKGMIGLIAATLDTDAKLRPLANINVGSKCSWYKIADELPQ
jgi:hypothetical protein